MADCAAHSIGLPHGLYGSGKHQFRVVADPVTRAVSRIDLPSRSIADHRQASSRLAIAKITKLIDCDQTIEKIHLGVGSLTAGSD